MIKDPPLLRIRRGFTRPTEALLAGFAGIPTGYLVDAMNGSGCLDYRIKPLVQRKTVMVGTAVTCHAGPSDNLALFGAVHAARKGDVLVAATDAYMGGGDHRRSAPGHGAQSGRGRPGDRWSGARPRRHSGCGHSRLLRRPHRQFAGAQRPRHGGPADRARRGAGGLRRYRGRRPRRRGHRAAGRGDRRARASRRDQGGRGEPGGEGEGRARDPGFHPDDHGVGVGSRRFPSPSHSRNASDELASFSRPPPPLFPSPSYPLPL